MKRVAGTALLLCFAVVDARAGTTTVAKSKGACRVVSLPLWAGLVYPRSIAALDPNRSRWPDIVAYNRPDLAFRTTGGLVLVALVAPIGNAKMFPQKVNPAVHPDRFAIDLERGTMRLTTEEEWRSSVPLSPRQFRYGQSETRLTWKDHLIEFKGKAFPDTGAQRPPFEPGGAHLAEDGRYLAISSWKGHFSPSCDWCFQPIFHLPYGGVFFVDVYDTQSATIKFSLEGRIHGDLDYLSQLFLRPIWLSSRYYFFPLDENAWNDLVLCDVDRISIGAADSRAISFNGKLPKHGITDTVPMAPSARVTSVTDKPVLDSEGRLHAIRVTVAMNVGEPGSYVLGMDLVAGNGQSVHKRIRDQMAAGAGQRNLDFDSFTLRELDADGPFTEAHLYLQVVHESGDERPPAPAESIAKVGMTGSYIIPRLPLRYTGNFSAKGVITGSGPRFDTLRIEVGVSSLTAARCTVYGSLLNAARQTIGFKQSQELEVGPGEGILALEFTGIRIAQSSGGPYRLRLGNLRCTNGGLGSKDLIIEGFAPEQFRYEAPDFRLTAAEESQSGVAGASIAFPFRLSVSGAFGEQGDWVDFQAEGLPAGTVATVRFTSLAAPGMNEVTVRTSADIAPGTYRFSVVGSGTTVQRKKIMTRLSLAFTVTGREPGI